MSETLKIDDNNSGVARIVETSQLFAIDYGNWGNDYKDHAAFIVRACINHDKLLAACKDLLSIVQALHTLPAEHRTAEDNSILQAKYHKAEAAIAAAEKEI